MKVIELIEQHRIKQGMTKTDLAEKAGISKQYLFVTLRYRQIKNIPLLKKISRILNIPDERMKKALVSDFSAEIVLKWEAVE